MDLASSSESLIDDLLEDYWFFKNLFTKNSRVLRYCHSDPYPSSSSSSLTSPEKTRDSDPKKNLEGSSLSREPSIDGSERNHFSEKIRVQEPRQVESFLQKKERMDLPKSGSRSAPGKIQEASTKRGLTRAPSLPPLEKREMDREATKMVTKLTRQFSENIRVLEPTRPSTDRFLKKKEAMFPEKSMNRTRGSSSNSVKIGLQRTQTMPSNISKDEDELEDQESDSRMGFLIREALISTSQNVPKVRQRPPRNLRTQESMVKQGSLNSSSSSSSSSSSTPKTLRKTLSSIETIKDIQRMKDCYDEPRGVTGMATPPRVPKDSRKEMKDQIKFWARAVASNVRQEC